MLQRWREDVYGLNPKDFRPWFASWAQHAETQIDKPCGGDELTYYRQILFPSWASNHATLFAEATKSLVYGSEEHITERNPTKAHQMHLPPRILQQMNAARGRLRTLAQRDLFVWITVMLETSSPAPCCEPTVFELFRELQRIGV
ncbi:uncharacterized protein BO97DRAFT_421941 [Aspergillus homomorphus CBS 101889]|uniref:Uncharacterized protein n=1 Tax=Aspergillus homomorphus (strain CBS 101889) TaxID=1450537 RepID=A0A395I7V6_ASPHC|nr:hypothetical protein BO97DRAFT_421941 [Aspergillus homomorphus CBS 101889]RAL15148.1 hypothetical protein BO97DRAFT_421941 [Aspergillus homomorphus CBS 101889]